MREVGELILKAIFDYAGSRREILDRVAALCQRFPIYERIHPSPRDSVFPG